MSAIATAPTASTSAQGHLTELDGIRGFAAVYVLFHHAWLESALSMPSGLHNALGFLAYGQAAVVVFIVLSGYLLMRPVAKSADSDLQGGLLGFASKRCKRILPPYYAAFVVSCLLALVSHHLPITPTSYEQISFSSILSHLFMIHNASMAWYQNADPPMWTVATEFQIYFVFALILLPVWRKRGIWQTVALSFLIAASFFLLPKFHIPSFFWACPWYLGLFSLGMCAAIAQWPKRSEDRKLKIPWLLLTIGGLLLYVGLHIVKPDFAWHHQLYMDILIGISAMGLIGYSASFAVDGKPASPLVRVFQSKFAVWLASFSYSLYLMHLPVLSIMARLLATWLSGIALCCSIWIFAVPTSVIASYMLYLLAERPFVQGKRP